MKVVNYLLSLMMLVAFSCKTASEKADKKLTLKFESKSGSEATGEATFSERNGKVTFNANLSKLRPGVHAIHIHEKGDCSAPDASSAGGHWNPTFKKHGKWGVGEYHRGDIGNFITDEFGNGSITLTTDEWCIGCGDQTRDILGKSVIVHENPDDYTTQPTGNAGGRMACAAIIK